MLGKLFDNMRNAGVFEKAIIIIHGDHVYWSTQSGHFNLRIFKLNWRHIPIRSM
jgi:hypothetical protein